MKILMLSAFLLQGLILFVDEFFFHRHRGLPTWEIIGHPLDSLSVVACFAFLYFFDYSATTFVIYLVLAVFSCVLITKDEFIHTAQATAQENWLHSLLFILHPIPLISAGWLWMASTEKPTFALMGTFVFSFMLYQIGYWGFYAKKRS